MRLLIVKTSSMGDVVHALPMATDLQRWLPQVRIDWLVEPAFAALPQLHPAVQQVHRLPWRKWRRALGQRATWSAMAELSQALRQARYDAVIDAQGLLKSALWARRAGAPVVGYDRHSIREPMASLLYAQRYAVDRGLHAVERCRRLAAALARAQGADAPGPQTPLAPPDFGLSALPAYEHPSRPPHYAVLIPNASRPEKHWPQPHWQAVGRHLQAQGLSPVVLWGSPAEAEMAQAIAAGCGGWVPPFLTVEEAARLLAGAAVVVGLDTGFAHVAAAVGRPVVGIYCDHEPGLTGITGPAPGASLGGKGQQPALADVMQALNTVCARAGVAHGNSGRA